MITAKGRLQGAPLQTHVGGTLAQPLNRIDEPPPSDCRAGDNSA